MTHPNYEQIAQDAGELAFEHELGESPLTAWRVYAIRRWNGRECRTINWFATYEAAQKHAARIGDDDGDVLDISEYARQPIDVSEADL